MGVVMMGDKTLTHLSKIMREWWLTAMQTGACPAGWSLP